MGGLKFNIGLMSLFKKEKKQNKDHWHKVKYGYRSCLVFMWKI